MKNNINPLVTQIVGYSLVIIIILWIVLQLMKKIGLVETKKAKEEGEKEAKLIEDNSQYFDPKLHRTITQKSYLLPSQDVTNLVTNFYSSFHWYNDDEEAIYNVFRYPTYKVQVSQLADEFQKRYSKDMLAYMYDKMNEKELNYIWQIIDKMK